MAHFKTENYGSSYCTKTGEFDVYASGEGIQSSAGEPTDYCTACYEAEPEWTYMSQEEFDKAAL